MSKINKDRIELVNNVLKTYAPWASISMRNNSLYCDFSHHGHLVRLIRDGSALHRNVQYPSGYTSNQATAQLIRYVKDLRRLPLQTWEYWTSEKIGLGSAVTLELLKDSDYGDEKKTRCILCGTTEYPNGIDWYHLKSRTGPCCWGEICKKT